MSARAPEAARAKRSWPIQALEAFAKPFFERPWLMLPIVVGAFVGLRSAVVAYKMPSGTMYPTLVTNDHLSVSGFAYGVWAKRLPERGDAIVFEFPYASGDETKHEYVKRVIALPGDVLTVDDGHPVINGWRIPRCRVGTLAADSETKLEVFVEFLNERTYLVAIDHDHPSGHQGPYTVWPDETYVLGDNRNNSSDSRTWRDGRGGGVPAEDVRGRAVVVWWPRWWVSLTERPVLPKGFSSLEPALAKCLAEAPPPERTRPPPPEAS